MERFFQVYGSQEGLAQLPDGDYQPTLPLTPAELHLKQVIESQWSDRSLIPSRGFGLHRPTPEQPWPMYSSLGSSLKAAIATGNVTLRSDAVVSHVIFDPDTRKARGVAYRDRNSKTTHEVFARTVVLCASTIESVRILLHSTEQYQPAGLTNPSGMLGRYLMDHVSTSTFFFLPNIKQPKTFDLSGCDSFFIPCFTNLESQQEKFLRGYGIWGGVQRFDLPSIVRKVGDAWGIPVPHIECAWSENEHLMLDHMHRQIDEIIKLAGGKNMKLTDMFHVPIFADFVSRMEENMAFSSPPGYYIHEVGGARMGTSPSNSVVNANNQVWESPNLFVTDGACWASSGWQSPTLTEMAITARASEFIAEGMSKGVF